MRILVLMTGLATALLAGAAAAQQDTAPQEGTLNTVQTLGTMHATVGDAPGTGSKPERLSKAVDRTEDAQIMASPVRADPAGSVAIAKPDDYTATGEPLRIAPYAKGVEMESKAKDGRK